MVHWWVLVHCGREPPLLVSNANLFQKSLLYTISIPFPRLKQGPTVQNWTLLQLNIALEHASPQEREGTGAGSRGPTYERNSAHPSRRYLALAHHSFHLQRS
jgi:hypothetical protein